jgi:gliding motility-associated-like protein
MAVFCTQLLWSQSNEGTEFWFGFMEHIDVGNNSKAVMISSKSNTKGRLNFPAAGFTRNFDIVAGEVTIIQLPSQAEVIGSETIGNKGIFLESQDPVSVYIHQYANMRSEATLVLPIESIGTDYYVMSYPGVSQFNFTSYSEFLIVATEDNTKVEIIPSAETRQGRKVNLGFTVSLDQGEVYQVQTKDYADDLTGSKIVADKKICVISGNQWTQVPLGCTFMDNLMEQMYAVGTWGSKYVTIPSFNAAYDIFRVMASEDDTNIIVEYTGGTNEYNLDAGKFVEYPLYYVPSVVVSDKPILVAQFNIGSSCSNNAYGDPSMLLINSIEQSRDTVTLFNSAFENIFENYISAIIKTDDIPITLFDGAPIAGQQVLSGVIDNGTFSYFVIDVDPGAHTIISPGCGVIASAYGYGNVESYAYGGGANFKNVNDNPLPDGGCLNDTVFFDSGLSEFRFDVEWDFGEGSSAVGVKAEHIYNTLDSFDVTMDYYDKCLEVAGQNKKTIFITLRDKVFAPDSVIGCENQFIELNATDINGATYLWKGPNNFSSTDQNAIVDSLLIGSAGPYDVIGIVSGCATFPATTAVKINPAPEPTFIVDPIFCSRETSVILDPGEFIAYQWSTGAFSREIEAKTGDLYSVTVTNEYDCPAAAEINIIDICPAEVFIPNIFTPNNDGINDALKVIGIDIVDFKLMIFDRWGGKVFVTESISAFWDGTINGMPMNIGVYTYVTEYTGKNKAGAFTTFTKSGTITLLR